MRRKQPHAGEVDAPGPHCLDDRRQPPRRTRDLDPAVRGAFGKSELARAEGKHRGVRTLEVELALVDLAEMDKEIGLDAARASSWVAASRSASGNADISIMLEH